MQVITSKDNEIIKELNIFTKNEIRKKEVFDYIKQFLKNLVPVSE